MIPGLTQKLGFWSKELIKSWTSKTDWIWFHAVSVGEINAVWPLIQNINKLKPNYPIMLSSTTRNGYILACEKTKDTNILTFYFPFDFPGTIKNLLNYAKIKLLVIVETEIWPNLLKECKKREIPAILVNARLSDKSFKNYHFFRFYFKNVVNLFSKVLSQSENDTKKFLSLGLNETKIKTLGNIKFVTLNDLEKVNNISFPSDQNDLRLLTFASTHRGEEEIALNTYINLLKDISNIRLIIAPRHIERTDEILGLITKNEFNPILRSKNQKIKSEKDIFVLDTIGELVNYYKISDITVLGGTFVEIGGHNILEPIRANSYTIIGPYDYKIKEISNHFLNKNALVKVTNTNELLDEIKEVLNNANLRKTRLNIGLSIIKENENVLNETTKQLLLYL